MSNFKQNRGVALILVLWMLVLATIMAGSFALTMRRELSIVNNARDLAEAAALTEAAITFAMQMLLLQEEELRWEPNGKVYEVEFSETIIRIKINDESGKINVNQPDEKLLEGALQQVGLDEEQRKTVIDSILDWQDNDDEPRPSGAELSAYESEGKKYGPANKPFQVLEELQLVLGMEPDLFKKLESLLTVYSKAKKINPMFASKEVLMTLPDADEELIDEYLFARENYKANEEEAPVFPYPESISGNVSGVYTLIAEAKLASGNTGKTKAVIAKRKSVKGLPYTILEWHNAPLNEKSLFPKQHAES